MPKVLRIINRFNLGGPTYNAAYLTKYMAPEFETLLVGGEKDETEETSLHIVTSLGIQPLVLSEMKRSINFFSDRNAYHKLKELIQEFKPDIVHTHASKAGFLGRLAAHHCKVPVIVHTFHGHIFHSYFNPITTTIYKKVERYVATKSTGIIAISEKQKYELSEINKICPAEKIKIIPLGFDLDKFQNGMEEKRKSFRSRYNIDEDEIAIGIIGRLVPIKNHSLFLEALKIVREKINTPPDPLSKRGKLGKIKIRAFIVGDGEERNNIEAKAKELGLDYNVAQINNLCYDKATVTFTSWIKDVDWVTAGVDIIALTSLNEGTPVSLIEAQAANKPIVSTAVGGIENVVIPNETAFLSDKNDVQKFAENLLKLIEDENLRIKMSQQGRAFVNGKFHYSRLVNDMKEYYNDLLKLEI